MKINLQKYSEYKDSGVDWLGEIPSGWKILPSKRFHQVKKQPNSKRDCNNVLSLTLRGVVNNDPDSPEGMVPKDYGTYQIFEKENLVFKLIDLENVKTSRVGIVHEKGIMSSAYIRLVLGEDNYARFAYYYFFCLYINEVYNNLGSGVRSTLGPTDLLNIPYLKPPLPEQTTIANFLDRKTALIDQAVDIKQKQIELLKERRQILIHKAVTRGLNAGAKLKDSGVEWIGQIPEGWGVKKLKYCLINKLKYGANESGVEYNASLPRYVRITDFGQDGKLSEDNKLSLSWSQGEDYLLKDGDILFARSGATVGKTYQFRKSMSVEDNYCFAGYLIKAESNHELILSDFLYLYTNSNLFNNWKEGIFNKATIENIGADKYSQLMVVIPPLTEQKEILEKFKIDDEKITNAISLKEQEIEKLKEYKATLINSAVTGKIKISNYAK